MPHAHELKDHSGTKGTETSHTIVMSTLTSFSLKSQQSMGSVHSSVSN